jgi:hypothetical protein
MIRLARYAGAAKKLVADNSPAVLTAVAVVGVVTTAILVAKAAPKAHIDLANEESERPGEADLTDKVLLTYRYYIPAVAVGTATIACIIGANTISTKRSAALASAYGLTELAFKEYREKAIEVIGEAKETKIHDEVMKDVVDRVPESSQIFMTDGGKQLFLDRHTERLFESDMESVRGAVNDINEVIYSDMYASLNDFYRLLGIPTSTVGEELGWTTDVPLKVRYSAQLHQGKRPVVVVDFEKAPVRDYNRFG